jgi:hypothetical protein
MDRLLVLVLIVFPAGLGVKFEGDRNRYQAQGR